MSDHPQVMVEHYRDLERKKILAMEPRELDVLVQKNVFKSEVFEIPAGWAYKTDESWNFIPYYSSSISAAWEVMEKFPISVVKRVEVFVGNVTVNVTLYPSTGSCKDYTASSNSFALSACRAALLAVMDL